MIIIRADGGPAIGSGHIMRCMTIARALQMETKVLFVTKSEESVAFIKDRGFQAVCLTGIAQESDCQDELPQMKAQIEKYKPECVLVDSYLVTTDYLKKLEEWICVAYMDDEGKDIYPVSCIINYNVYADAKKYRQAYKAGSTRLLVGPEYIPVRREFTETGFEIRQKADNVLITTGGSDSFNIAGAVLDKMMQFQSTMNLTFQVVCGAYNRHYEALKKKADKYPNIKIHTNVKEMWDLMAGCDLAVTAGGSTVYELCTLGVPMIGYIFADNQRMLMEYLNQEGVVSYCGDYRENAEEMLQKVATETEKYLDISLREKQSQKAKRIVDGAGAKRIAAALLSLHR